MKPWVKKTLWSILGITFVAAVGLGGFVYQQTSAFDAAMELLIRGHRPTAIFASQNLVTIGVFRALRTLGLHHSIALIGFDDFSLADLLDPPVTVVAA